MTHIIPAIIAIVAGIGALLMAAIVATMIDDGSDRFADPKAWQPERPLSLFLLVAGIWFLVMGGHLL